ncbi:MAG: 3-oxoadipate enol-lactonase [Geminicoccaceae bacterium]
MPETEANGITTHYRFDGPAAAPVVMLSNSLGTRLEMWDPQIPALAARYRVLRYDSRGHGRTSAPTGPYGIELLAQDAIALLDALGLERVHFCGLSKGGAIGQLLGARHGRRLISLTLCATACRLGTQELWNERIAAVIEKGLPALVDGVTERWFTKRYREGAPAEVERVQEMILSTPPQGYAASCAAIRDMDLCGLLGKIEVPTLVVAGEEDPATTPEIVREVHERIAGSRFVVVPRAAHLLNIEQAEVFNRTLLEFLNGRSKHGSGG